MPTTTISEETQKFLKELRKSMNLNSTGEVIDHLVTEMKNKPMEETPMEKDIEEEESEKEFNNIEKEMKNQRLDEINLKLSEMKELISITKDLIKQLPSKGEIEELKKQNPNELEIGKALGELKTSLSVIKTTQDSFKTSLSVLNDKLIFQAVMKTKLDEILNELQKSQQPPLLEPDQIKALTKFKEQWNLSSISEVVQILIADYYNLGNKKINHSLAPDYAKRIFGT